MVQASKKCKEAIDAGFTSVMIDASHHPFEENVETTKQVVEYAHARNVSVEAELGTVGGQEDDVIAEGVIYADPAECKHLVEATGIDCPSSSFRVLYTVLTKVSLT